MGACWSSFVTTWTWRTLLNHPKCCAFSTCDSCNSRLQVWQLIPILGYVIQRGKCFRCHKFIHPFWTLTEILEGLSWTFLPFFDFREWTFFILATTVLLIISTEDWFSHSFHPLYLIGLLPLRWTICGSPLRSVAVAFCLCLALGYFSQSIGAGDIDFLIVLTLIGGTMTTAITLLYGCLLTITNPAIYHHRPCPFIPYLSCGFLLSIVLQLF